MAADGDDLVLKVDGKAISGWTGVRVTQGVERYPADFDIELTPPRETGMPADAADAAAASFVASEITSVLLGQEGAPCQVLLGDDAVVTGYVDRIMPMVDKERHAVRVMGRGKGCDLVDCSAEWSGGQISGADAEGVASRLAQPYGVKVRRTAAAAGPAIPQFNLMIGETAWSIVERVTRFANLLAYEDGEGTLLLADVGKTFAASGFKQGENVERIQALYDMADRYSRVRCYRLAMDTLGDLGKGGDLIFTATDALVPRHRLLFLVAEAGSNGEGTAKKRAEWESRRRAGRGRAVTLRTSGWRDAAGKLWTPNTLVNLDYPAVGIAESEWLISEVTFTRRAGQDGGTRTELTLMPPDAFAVAPENLSPDVPDIPQQ